MLKIKCENEINPSLISEEIKQVAQNAVVFVLSGGFVQVVNYGDADLSEVIKNHDGAEQNAIDAALAEWEKLKEERTKAVEAITVVVDGMEFDGDEESQTRMARAITGLEPSETQLWKLTNNTIVYPTREQLKQALRLAGERQTELWAQYVPNE